jgi:hypothetical protein
VLEVRHHVGEVGEEEYCAPLWSQRQPVTEGGRVAPPRVDVLGMSSPDE